MFSNALFISLYRLYSLSFYYHKQYSGDCTCSRCIKRMVEYILSICNSSIWDKFHNGNVLNIMKNLMHLFLIYRILERMEEWMVNLQFTSDQVWILSVNLPAAAVLLRHFRTPKMEAILNIMLLTQPIRRFVMKEILLKCPSTLLIHNNVCWIKIKKIAIKK